MHYLFFLLLICTSLGAQVTGYVSTQINSSFLNVNALKQYGGQLYCAGYIDITTNQTYLSASDNTGQILWQKTYPQPNRDEYITDLAVNRHGLYCVGGSKDTSQSNWDGIIMRLDLSGNLMWQRRLPDRLMLGVVCLDNGDVLVTGGSTRLRLDSTGTVVWSRTDTCSMHDLNYQKIFVTPTNGVYCIGDCLSVSDPSLIVTKTDLNGQVIWSKQTGGGADFFTAAAVGGSAIFISGHTLWPVPPSGLESDVSLFKLDTNGIPMASAGVLPGSGDGRIEAMTYSPYNTLVLISKLNSAAEVLVSEFNSVTLTATRTIGFSPGVQANAIEMDSTGNTWFSMRSGYNVVGGCDYTWNFGCGFTSAAFPLPQGQCSSNPLTTISTSGVTVLPVNVWDSLLTIPWNSCVNPVSVDDLPKEQLQVFPNPTTSSTTLDIGRPAEKSTTIVIVNSQGQQVQALPVEPGQQRIIFSVEGWCPGIYFMIQEDGNAIPFEVIAD